MVAAQVSWILLLVSGFLDMDHFIHVTDMTVGGYFLVNGITKWKPTND